MQFLCSVLAKKNSRRHPAEIMLSRRKTHFREEKSCLNVLSQMYFHNWPPRWLVVSQSGSPRQLLLTHVELSSRWCFNRFELRPGDENRRRQKRNFETVSVMWRKVRRRMRGSGQTKYVSSKIEDRRTGSVTSNLVRVAGRTETLWRNPCLWPWKI